MNNDFDEKIKQPIYDKDFFNEDPISTGKSVKELETVIDQAFSESGRAGYDSPLAKILHGIKIMGKGVDLAPIADDTIGLVFISRPLLNLSDSNCKGPRFSKFYKSDRKSLLNYVRCLLDRRIGETNKHPALDNKSAWMTPLINLVETSDGFADLSLSIKNSTPGIRQEVHQMPEGILDDNGPNTINMTLRNTKGSIVQMIMENWIHYIPEVRLGDNGMEPYWTALAGNWCDWGTRIYHFIVNPNMISIEQCIMTAGHATPTIFPQGSMFAIDRSKEEVLAPNQDTFSARFEYAGSRANTIEVAESFNLTSFLFEPNLAEGAKYRDKYYVKLDRSELLDYGNYQARPIINLNTMEFEWYVERSLIENKVNANKTAREKLIKHLKDSGVYI